MTTNYKPFQFGIRHLLGAMFAVALLSALIAPWVRGWSAGQWLNLGAQTGMVVVTFAICLGGHVWSRRTVSRRLGEMHFRVPARIWGASAWSPVKAYVLIGFATFMLLLLTAATIVSGGKMEAPFIQGVYAGMFSAMGLTQLWHPPDQLFVGEHGVALVGRFIPWDKLWCAYQPGGGPAPLFLKTVGWALEVYPGSETEQPLAGFLQQRAKPWDNPPPRRKK